MSSKTWIVVGSVSACIAVALGAFAAHGLESWTSEHFPSDADKRLANWKTGATYQMFHSIGLIIVGLVSNFTPRRRAVAVAGGAMTLGIVLFSGMLYAWVLTDYRLLVMIVPLGGISFMVGWTALAWAGMGIEK